MELSRRELVKAALVTGGARAIGFSSMVWTGGFREHEKDYFRRGEQLGVVDFMSEGSLPTDIPVGRELDGRLYTDLSTLAFGDRTTPTDKFFIRTRASSLLDDKQRWVIKIGGRVKQPVDFTMDDLAKLVKPAGLHLLECSGNTGAGHFGMLSAADWAGASLADVLDAIHIEPQATRVLISGFDRYLSKSTSSIPGASWVFTLNELRFQKAFLATEMNGRPLIKDHGAPVRLIVPGWYGCTCIKWVNEITLVDDDVEATSQMKEYAARTLQAGVPNLARDYEPASVDQAGMPIRVERWRVSGKIGYRVVGIIWGGSRPVNILEIQFNPDEPYVRVDSLQKATNDPWRFWTHAWLPRKPGLYSILLRVKDPKIRARKMDAGFYQRVVEIDEV